MTRKLSSPMGRGAQHTAITGCPHPGPTQPWRSWKSYATAWITRCTAWPPPDAHSHCWHRCSGFGVFAITNIPAGCELWLAFGTGKSFRYLVAHQISASFGPEMPCALPMFHALTGCALYPALLKEDSMVNMEVTAGTDRCTMNTIERFVKLLFDRTSTCTNVNHARRKLFPRKTIRCSKSRQPKLL